MTLLRSRLFQSLFMLIAVAGCTTPSTAPTPASPDPTTEPAATAPAPTETASPPASAPSGDGATASDPRGVPGRTPAGIGGTCGGIAGFHCQKELYCSFPLEAMCGAADQTGTCQARPEACTFEYSPVCGCDDKTYSNACAAATAGVSVAKKGECSASPSSAPPAASLPTASKKIAEGQLCGTRGVPGECADGLYCAYRNKCGEDDSGGACAKKTKMCTKIYKPVCGCDGKTYGNACTAAGAGVSVASQGECAGSP